MNKSNVKNKEKKNEVMRLIANNVLCIWSIDNEDIVQTYLGKIPR